MSTILLTGSEGMLGSAVVPYLIECGHNVHSTDIATLDVRNRDDVWEWVNETKPDIVCHLAAETSLEICEEEPDHAWLTNAIGTKNVALECRNAGIPMAYISSAGIFDGTKDGPYTEFDTPSPINVYGASKLQGEHYVRQYVPESWVCRAGWMMGGGAHLDHKFVHHVTEQLDAGVKQIHAVIDKSGSPTYAPDFAILFERLITGNDYGTYHTVSTGTCTRYDVARAIVEILKRDDVEVLPVSSLFFATTFHAPRPASESMRNYCLDLVDANSMRPWREALEDYLTIYG